MKSPELSTLIQVGVDILNASRDPATKSVMAQTGDVVAQQVDSNRAEWWQHVGFCSIPPNPVPGQSACQGVVARRGDMDACIASRDLRGQGLAGNLSAGETCVYAPGADGNGQARILLKANGNIALYTAQGNAAGGQSVTIQCNADGSIALGGPYGGITIGQNGIVIAHSSGAAIQLSGGNATIIGNAVAINGGAVSIGANATQPVVWGPAGVNGVGSTSVKVAI